MGACSSRPRVSEDAPQPEVDHWTREETTAAEAVAAASSDNHAFSEKEEVFLDTLDHNHEQMQVPTNDADLAEEEKVPLVVEKHVVEVQANDVPIESEDLHKLPEVAGVKYSKQEDATAIDDVPENDEPKTAHVEADTNKVVAENSAVLESVGKWNTPAEDVQEVTAPPDPENPDSGAPDVAEPESEGKAGVSESAAQPASGNPLQAFVSNVTKGWGWH